MTLTLDLETLLKITAPSLTKDTLWVKYELDWTNGREYMNLTKIYQIILL